MHRRYHINVNACVFIFLACFSLNLMIHCDVQIHYSYALGGGMSHNLCRSAVLVNHALYLNNTEGSE